MKIVQTAEELGKVMKSGQYPIRVQNADLANIIDAIRNLSDKDWEKVRLSIDSISNDPNFETIIGGDKVTLDLITPISQIAVRAVGLQSTMTAVIIANAGNGIKTLDEIRSHKWFNNAIYGQLIPSHISMVPSNLVVKAASEIQPAFPDRHNHLTGFMAFMSFILFHLHRNVRCSALR